MASIAKTRKELEELIKEVMSITTITPLINKHIDDLVLLNDMTFLEIMRCIVYIDEVLQRKIEPFYGIKTQVLSIREQSNKYFKQKELDLQKQSEEGAKIVQYQDNNIIFNIKSLKSKKRNPKQFFDVAEIELPQGEENGNS